MDNNWGDSLSKEFSMQMPVYGENVNFGSYIYMCLSCHISNQFTIFDPPSQELKLSISSECDCQGDQ